MDFHYLVFCFLVMALGVTFANNSKRLITTTAIVGLMLALVNFAGFYLLLRTFEGL